ncbi:MAG: hypothetical protein QW614_05750 [Candidatus Caldarchaeum sp.]
MRMGYHGSAIEPPFIPSGVQPQYDRGECFCSVCRQTFSNRVLRIKIIGWMANGFVESQPGPLRNHPLF